MAAPKKLDSRDRFNLSALTLHHRQLSLFFILLISMAGIMAYFSLGQREDPDFTFRAMVVRTMWPGATAEQVDREVTERLERKLLETANFDKTTSYSKRGESLIILQIKDSSPADEVADTWYQVRKRLTDIKHTLPPEVRGPFFNDEFGDVYGSIFAFTGDGFNHSELRSHVEDTRQRLMNVPDVAKIELIGIKADKIYVEVEHARLAQLGLGAADIQAAIGAQNAMLPAGTLQTDLLSIPVQITGQYQNAEDVANTPLRANGRNIRLGDIARVWRGYVDPADVVMRYRGQEAIGLAVSMVSNGDVLKLGKNLQDTMEAIRADLPIGVEFAQVSDQPAIVKESVQQFMTVLIEAVVIVLMVSFFALKLRAGMVVALTIPFVLAATFLFMKYFGIDIHRISTGALIIALGLLVDDAMISIEMMARKLEEGWDKFSAATYAFRHTAGPMLTGTLITAAGFLPIATAKSSTGEYTFAIFAVVTIALLISWVAAVTVTPFLGYTFLQEQKIDTEEHDAYDGRFYRAFRATVEWCITWRKTVILLTFMAFMAGGAGMGMTEKQFFPSSNRLEIMVELWLPEGASVAATETQVKRLESTLIDNDDVNKFVSYVGNGSPRFFLSLDQKLYRKNFAQTIVLAKDLEARERIVATLRDTVADFAGVRGRVSRVPLGPPVDYPVQFRVVGPDIQTIKGIADQVADVIRADPNTLETNVDWGQRAPALRIEIDQAKARALGVSTQSISQGLQGVLSGVTIGQFREGNRLIDIDLRGLASEANNVSAIENINLRTALGTSVPLSQIGKVEQVFEEPILWRRSRELTITARADIIDGVQAPDVAMLINPRLETIRANLPAGYRIDVGGAWEENVKAQSSIGAGYPLMIGITLTLLMIQLQSFSRVAIVALTAPLGIIGVAMSLLIFKQPFGFVALLGTIALAGMIMRNSVILVDQIQQDIAEGFPTWVAIRESAVRRFRPIILTAAAAILAMIPLTKSVLWGPMAYAIMGGLFIGTILTLLFVPALYAAWYRVKPPQQEKLIES